MNQSFQESLIKDRIAETVFEQMFREGSKYYVYPLGYKNTLPIIKQFKGELTHQDLQNKYLKLIQEFEK